MAVLHCTRSVVLFVGIISFAVVAAEYSGDGSGSGDYGDYYGSGDGNYSMPDPCEYFPCQNGGSCHSNGMRYECECPERFYGWNCEEEIEDGKLKIEVKNCEMDNMVEGDSKTVGEWCTQDTRGNESVFSVRLVGAVAMTTYTLEVVRDYQEEETIFSTEFMAFGEDITALISGLTVTAPDAETIPDGRTLCNNYDAFMSMRVYPTMEPDNKNETLPRHRVTVLCNQRDVDIELTVSGATGPITSAADTSFGNYAPFATFSIQMSSGSDPLPMLGNNAAYYVVAFLTKRAVQYPDMCMQGDEIPEVTFADHILWYKTFRGVDELSNFDSELKGMNLNVPDNCGEYNLVILVDPLMAIYGGNRCNNYYVMPAYLSACSAPEAPRCKITTNPFTNGKETVLSFHGNQRTDIGGSNKPDNRMYKFKGYGTWQEEMDSDEMMRKNMYEVNRDGYGRLKLLEMVIRDQIQDGTLTCGGLDETEIMNQIKEMEGLEPDNSTDNGFDLNMMIPEYNQALGYLFELNNEYLAPENVMASAQQSAANLAAPMMNDSMMSEKVAYWIGRTAWYAVSNISDAMMENRVEGLMMEAFPRMCMMGDIFREVGELSKRMAEWDEMNLDWELKIRLENATRTMIMMKQFTPNATFIGCMDTMFRKLVMLSTGALPDLKWMFEDECEWEENSCLRKVRNLCSGHNGEQMCEEETSFNDDEEFCVMRHTRDMIKREYRAFGIHDIRKKLRNNERDEKRYMGMDNGNCNGADPVKPRNDPLVLYKMREDGVVMKGEPQISHNALCWRPVAVCTCADCSEVVP